MSNLVLPLSKTRAATFKLRDVVQPKSNRKATPYVFGAPYRRVYEDKDGLFITWFGNRKTVLLSDL